MLRVHKGEEGHSHDTCTVASFNIQHIICFSLNIDINNWLCVIDPVYNVKKAEY